MTDDRFERLKQITKNEFGVTIVKTDNSKTSQMFLAELKTELKTIENDHIKNDMLFDELVTECFSGSGKQELGYIFLKFTAALVDYQYKSTRIYSYYIKDATAFDFEPVVKLLDEDLRVRIQINDDGLMTKFYPYCRIVTIKKDKMELFWVKQMISMLNDALDEFSEFNMKSICDTDYESDDRIAYYIYREVNINYGGIDK